MKKNNDFEKNKSEKKKQEKAKKILIVIISVLIAIILTATYMFINNKNKEKDDVIPEDEIAYTELIKQIDEGNVTKIKMTVGSTTVKVTLKDEEKPKTGIVPSTQAFIELVQVHLPDHPLPLCCVLSFLWKGF